MPAERFIEALNDQVANEFAASHQYVAVAASTSRRPFPSWPASSTRRRWRSAGTR